MKKTSKDWGIFGDYRTNIVKRERFIHLKGFKSFANIFALKIFYCTAVPTGSQRMIGASRVCHALLGEEFFISDLTIKVVFEGSFRNSNFSSTKSCLLWWKEFTSKIDSRCDNRLLEALIFGFHRKIIF